MSVRRHSDNVKDDQTSAATSQGEVRAAKKRNALPRRGEYPLSTV